MTTPTPVDALSDGDHACLTFSDAEERLDIVAAFVRDGLTMRQKVVCVTESLAPDRLVTELLWRAVPADSSIHRGQLAVRSSDESWLADGALTAAKMIDLLSDQLDAAAREGYRGLRVTADMCWATRPLNAVDQLLVFESEVNKLFADGRLTAICQYDRHSFDAVTLAFAAGAHSRAVAATVYHEDPVLRVCRQHSPPGIRLAGEIDFARAELLDHALAESLRLDHHVHVNLAQLRFIDAAAAATIVRAAHSLPPERRMTVVCRGVVRRMLALVGAADAPSLRVLMAHAEP
jgi:anti-anti-sigma regulatory factor